MRRLRSSGILRTYSVAITRPFGTKALERFLPAHRALTAYLLLAASELRQVPAMFHSPCPSCAYCTLPSAHQRIAASRSAPSASSIGFECQIITRVPSERLHCVMLRPSSCLVVSAINYAPILAGFELAGQSVSGSHHPPIDSRCVRL